jgi:signal transduction histidine kinase
MIDMTRLQTGTLRFQIERGDLSAVVRDAVTEQRLLWPERVFTLALPPAAVPVMMDSGRIGQVVTNYLVNALKYSPEAAPIDIRVAVARDEAHVDVIDHGPGISLHEQAHIWKRFYRAPDVVVASGSKVGLGLGLYLCQAVIARHGGQVGVMSSPGHGATFWFTLPLAPAEE